MVVKPRESTNTFPKVKENKDTYLTNIKLGHTPNNNFVPNHNIGSKGIK